MMRQIRKQRLTFGRRAAGFGLFGLVVALFGVPPVSAQQMLTGISQEIVTNPLTGVAIDGMDPVSYFTEGEPLSGAPDFELVWKGVPWFFASAATRAVFAAAPEIYAPQFGGHGLTGLSRGHLSDGNPHIFVVFSNRLYLFYSTGNRQAFELARLPVIESAEANWQTIGPGAGGNTAEARP
jgi:hypothetical protein